MLSKCALCCYGIRNPLSYYRLNESATTLIFSGPSYRNVVSA